MNFYFFPAGNITQISNDSFRLVDIYGGEFVLDRFSLEVYLNGDNFQYLDILVKSGIIYKSPFEKEEPFNRRRVLENLDSFSFEGKPKSLNIGEVTLEIVQECPYSCEGCFRDISKDNPLSLFRLKNLVLELKDMGLKKLSLSGGEITLNEFSFNRFKELLSFSKSQGIEIVRLLTTGFDSNKVLQSLDYGIDEVQISVDGLEEFHDSYKGFMGSFERAINSIKRLQDKDINLTTNTVVNRKNLNVVSNLIDYLSQFNINTIRLTKIMSADPSLRLGVSEAKSLYDIVKNKQSNSSIRIINAYGNCTNILNCVGGIVYAHISSNGNVFACDYDVENPAGNIQNSSFQDIWTNSNVFTPYRSAEKILGVCSDCSSRSLCFGNCRIDQKFVKRFNSCETHSKQVH